MDSPAAVLIPLPKTPADLVVRSGWTKGQSVQPCCLDHPCCRQAPGRQPGLQTIIPLMQAEFQMLARLPCRQSASGS